MQPRRGHAARWSGEVSGADAATGLAAETHVPAFVRSALIGWALVKAFPLLWP